ncbi:MAG TPA: recombinase XerC, partial [Thermoanaerobacter sp.]|nr:recombinase XerC [Thermoanaerobacter sp.]
KKLLNSIDGPFKERDYAIITLFLNCGLRVSELVNINLDDIKDDKLTVIGKGNK